MMAQRKRNRKWLWIIIGVVVVVLVIVGIVIGLTQNNSQNNEEKKVETNSEQGEVKKETKQTEATTEEEPPKKVVQYTGEDPNKSDDLTGVITYAGVNNGTLTIRTNIDQYLSEGTCELILERDSATIYNSRVDIWADVSTSTCKGYDVPVSELGGGNVQIIINLTSSDRTGVIRGEVEV